MNRGRFDGADALANHNGFIPTDEPRFQKVPDPSTQARYNDDQLYALGLYIYSLTVGVRERRVRVSTSRFHGGSGRTPGTHRERRVPGLSH